jgi:hypothetical protein
MGLLVEKVAVGDPPTKCSGFPLSLSTHQRSVLIHLSPTLYNLSKITSLQINFHRSSRSKFNTKKQLPKRRVHYEILTTDFTVIKLIILAHDFKLSPCCVCYILCSGWFPGVWILCRRFGTLCFGGTPFPSYRSYIQGLNSPGWLHGLHDPLLLGLFESRLRLCGHWDRHIPLHRFQKMAPNICFIPIKSTTSSRVPLWQTGAHS